MKELTPTGRGEASDNATAPAPELTPRARTVGVVTWCSFLAAAGATTVLFAFLDPAAVQRGDVPPWWTSRHTVYAVGFFFCWLVAACSAALTIYMAHTDRPPSDRPAGQPTGRQS
jgi:hypothetical protein